MSVSPWWAAWDFDLSAAPSPAAASRRGSRDRSWGSQLCLSLASLISYLLKVLLLPPGASVNTVCETKFGYANKEMAMSRPATKELTERELEVMHVFWKRGEMTAVVARDQLAETGVDRAYVTVANLVRILVEKGFLQATNDERPFSYRPIRSFEDVSGTFVGDLIDRVFGGSREKMLVHLLGGERQLTGTERELLEQVLEEQE